MSLINKVLKDLDKRKQQNKQSESSAQGLTPRYAPSMHKPGSVKKLVLTIVIILALLAIIWGLFFPIGGSDISNLQKHVQKSQATVKRNLDKVRQQQQKQRQKQLQQQEKQKKAKQANQAAKIISAEVNVRKDHLTKVVLGLTKAVKYRIDHQKQGDADVIVLDLHDTKAHQLNIQLPDSLSALEKVKPKSSANGDYQLRFTLHSGAELRSINMNKQSDPVHLTLSFVLPQKQRQAIKQSIMAVTRAQQQQKERKQAKQAYKKALEPLQEGNYSKARHDLTEVVHQYPFHLKARETLVKLLLKHNELQQAYQYLKHALDKRPEDVGLVQLKARYYYQQNLLQKALDTLESIDPPELKQHTAYYAFTAALQRQLGNDQVAAQLYKQLLNVAPQRSQWWLGLGLAYEHSGQTNRAHQAYQKALDTGNLNPNLQAYVASKLNQ